ncbi:MAG: nucleotidyltransferase domain-containing protein [Candidatus Woesearchaeota archaeon]
MFKNTYKLINYLIENKEDEFSIYALSKILKIDYKTIYVLIDNLKNSLNIRKQSKVNFVSFKANLTNEIYLVEKQRLENILKNKNLKIIYEELEKLNEQFILLLFGSYAKNTQTKNSDIDLLLISNDSDLIKKQLEILPLSIHLTCVSNKEFISMLNSKKFTVVSEAVKNNVVLFGVEEYYRFLKNVN